MRGNRSRPSNHRLDLGYPTPEDLPHSPYHSASPTLSLSRNDSHTQSLDLVRSSSVQSSRNPSRISSRAAGENRAAGLRARPERSSQLDGISERGSQRAGIPSEAGVGELRAFGLARDRSGGEWRTSEAYHSAGAERARVSREEDNLFRERQRDSTGNFMSTRNEAGNRLDQLLRRSRELLRESEDVTDPSGPSTFRPRPFLLSQHTQRNGNHGMERNRAPNSRASDHESVNLPPTSSSSTQLSFSNSASNSNSSSTSGSKRTIDLVSISPTSSPSPPSQLPRTSNHINSSGSSSRSAVTGLSLGKRFEEGRGMRLSEGLGLEGSQMDVQLSSSSVGSSSSIQVPLPDVPAYRRRTESNKRHRRSSSNDILQSDEDEDMVWVPPTSSATSSGPLAWSRTTGERETTSSSLSPDLPNLSFPPALGSSPSLETFSDRISTGRIPEPPDLNSLLDEISDEEHHRLRRETVERSTRPQRSASTSTVSSFSTVNTTTDGGSMEIERERSSLRELRSAISRSRRLRERLEEGTLSRRGSINSSRSNNRPQNEPTLSDSRTSNESQYWRNLLDLAGGEISIASSTLGHDGSQNGIERSLTTGTRTAESRSSSPFEAGMGTSADNNRLTATRQLAESSTEQVASSSSRRSSRSTDLAPLSSRLADIQSRLRENMRDLDSWQGRNETLLSQIRRRTVDVDDLLEGRRDAGAAGTQGTDTESAADRWLRERRERNPVPSRSNSSSQSRLVGMSVASRRQPSLNTTDHNSTSSTSRPLWGELGSSSVSPLAGSLSAPTSGHRGPDLPSLRGSSSSTASTRSPQDSLWTRTSSTHDSNDSIGITGRRSGALDFGGRLRGPSRRANEEWLGLPSSSRERPSSPTTPTLSWRDRIRGDRTRLRAADPSATPSTAFGTAFSSPEERRASLPDESEIEPPSTSTSSTLPSLPSLRSRSPFSLNFASHAPHQSSNAAQRPAPTSPLPDLDDLLSELESSGQPLYREASADAGSERRRRFSERMAYLRESSSSSSSDQMLGGTAGEQISSRLLNTRDLLGRDDAHRARMELYRSRRAAGEASNSSSETPNATRSSATRPNLDRVLESLNGIGGSPWEEIDVSIWSLGGGLGDRIADYLVSLTFLSFRFFGFIH